MWHCIQYLFRTATLPPGGNLLQILKVWSRYRETISWNILWYHRIYVCLIHCPYQCWTVHLHSICNRPSASRKHLCKWQTDCIYKAFYPLILSFTHTKGHHVRYQSARQEQLGVMCLVQRNIGTPSMGDWTSNLPTARQPLVTSEVMSPCFLANAVALMLCSWSKFWQLDIQVNGKWNTKKTCIDCAYWHIQPRPNVLSKVTIVNYPNLN